MIDFGCITTAAVKHISHEEQQKYHKMHAHIAPEIVSGASTFVNLLLQVMFTPLEEWLLFLPQKLKVLSLKVKGISVLASMH